MFVCKTMCLSSGAVVAILVVLCHSTTLGRSAPAALLVPESQSNCMTQWLSSLELSSENASSYASIFHRQAITEKALHLLSLQDLESIGVATFGHRILIHNTLNGGATLCLNGGECNPIVSTDDAFRCDCLDGFTGSSCETITSCSAHVCLNGGTCSQSEVKCQCPSGYSGERCEQDPCHLEPCVNGGTCTTLNGSYNCSCPFGYGGASCQTAWLTQNDYRDTLTRIGVLESYSKVLSNSIKEVKQTIEQARKVDNGPRFFAHWTTIEEDSDVEHIEHFIHSSTKYFTVLYSNNSIITYSFDTNDELTIKQTLMVSKAATFVVFVVDDIVYLAVARDSSSGSKVFEWSNEEFVFFKRLSTAKGSGDVEFVSTPRQGNYLIYACNYQTGLINYPTVIYKFVSRQFHVYQYLNQVTRSSSVNSVVTPDDEVLLVVAHSLENGTSRTIMYHWNGTFFDDRTNHHQVIPTLKLGTKVFLFTIESHTFLVGQSPSDNTVATAFRYYRPSRQFVKHADVYTPGTLNVVEYFHTKTEHFLVLAISQNITSGGTTSTSSSVSVYRIEGAGFQHFQEIQTSFRPSVLSRFSQSDSCKGITVAGSNGKVELYHWSDSVNRCS